MDHLTNRNGTYHLRMRVPKRFHGIEPRRIIKLTLRTDSLE